MLTVTLTVTLTGTTLIDKLEHWSLGRTHSITHRHLTPHPLTLALGRPSRPTSGRRWC